MSDEKQTDIPTLAHGPNPAVSAQPGTEQQGYSEPEYPPATATQPVPTSDHGEMKARAKARAGELKHLEKTAGNDPAKEGIHDDGGVKLGASGEEQAASTPNPGEAADGGADDPERHGAGRPSTGPVRQTSGGGAPDEPDSGRVKPPGGASLPGKPRAAGGSGSSGKAR